MNYITRSLSLDFWIRLQTRLGAEFKTKSDTLAKLLLPRDATFESAPIELARAAEDRTVMFDVLREIELIQLFSTEIFRQTSKVEFDEAIPSIQNQIKSLSALISVYEQHLKGLPLRQRGEDDLRATAAKFAGLANGGSGEVINADRQRLRGIVVPLLVAGSEEGSSFEQSSRILQTLVDEYHSFIMQKRSSTLVSLVVPAAQVRILNLFDIEYTLLDVEVAAEAEVEADVEVAAEAEAEAVVEVAAEAVVEVSAQVALDSVKA